MENMLVIGRAEDVDFSRIGFFGIPARIDTGAKTSSVWATQIKEENGKLSFVLFGKSSPFYTGKKIITKQYDLKMVASSIGAAEERYVVKLSVKLHSRQIRASFTLANRSAQAYPILIGRNVLRGKFIVDVKKGKSYREREQARALALNAQKSKVKK